VLPKPDKSKKSKNTEQLDLVDTISTADKLKHKRRWLYTAIFLTIGLSFLFWFYHTAKNLINHFSFSPPQVSLPSSSENLSSTLDSQITQILSSNFPGWSVSIYTNKKVFNWTKNTLNFTELEISSINTKLSSKKDKITSNISSYLPQGIGLQEESSGTAYHLLITIPDQQILFVITFPQNFAASFSTISKLVSTLYWTIVQH
jgi:hypothetical protein